jgi:hypothetical protein
MKKALLFICLCLMFFYYFKSKAIIVVDRYYVNTLGDSGVDWLFYSTSPKEYDYGEGIISGVESIGYNDEVIIVECSLEKFYIIQYKKNKKPYFDEKILIGPLNEKNFSKKKRELNINNVEFSIYL